MKKIKVNQDVCIGCGACAGMCPEVFELTDNGVADVKKGNEDFDKLNDSVKENVTDAKEGCPAGAISVEEE